MNMDLAAKVSLGERSESELVLIHFQDTWVEYQSLDKQAREKILNELPERLKTAVLNSEKKLEDVKVEWSDLPILRIRVLEETPEALLRARAAEIRTELQALVGDDAFKRLRPNGVVDERSADKEVLRADLIQTVELIGQACSHSLCNEGFRKGIAAWLIKKILPWVIAGGFSAIALLSWNHEEPWKWVSNRFEFFGTALVVAAFGVLGAFVSANRRMVPPPIQASSFGAWFSLRQFYNATKFALVLGGIFAIIWWFLVLGGVVMGKAFPEFEKGRAVPNALSSWALLAIWSFLAGFAERLVIDTLDKLASTGAPVQFARPQDDTATKREEAVAQKTADSTEESPSEAKRPGDEPEKSEDQRGGSNSSDAATPTSQEVTEAAGREPSVKSQAAGT